MASLIGALRVTLGLDTANFDADARKAKGKARALAGDVKKELASAFDIQGAVKGLVAGLAVTELAALAGRALDYASSLGEVAQQLGVTTKELQVYRYAATQVGVSTETMDAGLAKLTRTIGEAAAGSKAQATTFRELGVSVTDANGNLLTAGQIIPRLADALARIKDPATRARYEVDLFGKAGQKLDTLLAGGSKQIDALRDAAERLGIVLSDDAIAKADETADKLAEIKLVLEANIANAVAENSGAILSLANSFIQLAAAIPGAINAYRRWRQEAALRLANVIDSSPLGLLPDSVKGTGTVKRNARLALGELNREAALDNLGLGRGLGFLKPRAGVPSIGALPSISAAGGRGRGGGAGGRSRASSGSKAADDWLGDLQRATRDAIKDGINEGLLDPDKAAAEHARSFYDRLGIDPDEQKGIVGGIDRKRDARLENIEIEGDERRRLEDQLQAKKEEQVRTLAGLYENLMRGGTKAFLADMADIGFSIIAQMAAGLAMGKGLGGAFQGALGAVLPGFGGAALPGFATGGSFRVGGVGGVDRNVVAFKATRGEMVDIRRPGNDNAGGRQVVEIVPSPYFDVRARQAAAPVGQAAAIGGSQIAQNQLARKSRRRLG